MVKRLYEQLCEIKKERDLEKRMGRLKELCSDGDTLNDALEIVKNESTSILPFASLTTAFFAIILSFVKEDWIKIFGLVVYLVILRMFTNFELSNWTKLYYDLIELRRERRGEHDILKLDIIISKVDTVNTSINIFEKNVNTKLEAIEQEIKTLKKK